MKTLKKHIGNFSFILAMLILFQGCKVYHKDSVTLQKAVESGERTKIETKLNNRIVHNKVIFEDDKYFGVKKINGAFIKIPIDENKISKVRLQNKTLSTIYTILLPIAIVVGAGLTFLAGGGLDWKDSGSALDLN